MNIKNKKYVIILRIVLIVLSALQLIFIFSNSLKNADTSASQSKKIVKVVKENVNRIAPKNNISESLIHTIVRKAAHFTEFFVFSVFVTLAFISFGCTMKVRALGTLVTGAVSAVSDELLQLTSSGRSCEVRDMFIDFGGILLAFLFVSGVYSLIKKILKAKTSRA